MGSLIMIPEFAAAITEINSNCVLQSEGRTERQVNFQVFLRSAVEVKQSDAAVDLFNSFNYLRPFQHSLDSVYVCTNYTS